MWMTIQNQLCIGFFKHEFLLVEQSICPFYALERETSNHLYSIVLIYGNYGQILTMVGSILMHPLNFFFFYYLLVFFFNEKYIFRLGHEISFPLA